MGEQCEKGTEQVNGDEMEYYRHTEEISNNLNQYQMRDIASKEALHTWATKGFTVKNRGQPNSPGQH